MTTWFMGLDIHQDFCAVAVCENGRLRFAGKVETTLEQLAALVETPLPDDEVALEATSSARARSDP
jgi:hypothetical protein